MRIWPMHLLRLNKSFDNDDKSSLNKSIGIFTPLDFTRYQEYTRGDKEKDPIEKKLE